MQMPSIFRRKEEDQAPEVEVRGDEAVIKKDDGEPERKVKMPKTTFA